MRKKTKLIHNSLIKNVYKGKRKYEGGDVVMKKILVPVDGVEIKPELISLIKEMIGRSKVEIDIIYVQVDTGYATHLHPGNMSGYPEILEAEKRRANNVIDAIKSDFDDLGNTLKGVVLSGDPAEEIIKYAEDEGVDIIVMATHGLKPSKKFIMGSVTSKVVHHSKVPVLVVH